MIKKRFFLWKKEDVVQLSIAIVTSFIVCCATTALATDIYVDDDTCPDSGSGISSDPFCSIQDAINSATYGDDVLVNPGTYLPIIMKTGVDVLKAQTEKPIIITIGKTGPLVDFLEGTQDATIDGFVLDDSDRILYDTRGYAIVRITGYYNKYDWDQSNNKNLTVSNCDLKGPTDITQRLTKAGITVHATLFNTKILNNTFRNIKGTAIVVGREAGRPLKYCTLTIEGNTIEENNYSGIYLKSEAKFWNIIVIRNNTITRNNMVPVTHRYVGIRLTNIHGGTRDGGLTFGKENCGATVEGNDISFHDLAGIVLEKTQSLAPHIINNTIHDNNMAGINIMGYSKVTIVNNDIYNNGRAGITFNSNYLIHAGPSSSPVLIENNDIHDNDFAGISNIDYVTGAVNIVGNNLYGNTRAGIALFNAADDIVIESNQIHNNDTAGIYTGKWYGLPAQRHNAGPEVMFERSNGPVHLTINKNTVYNNLAGLRIDHASGTISNNLVYGNTMAGIRFSGKNVGAYEPFGEPWGITSVTNNTVSDNGQAGIVYDNINYVPQDGDGSDQDGDGERDFTDIPRMFRVDGIDPTPISMMNNIVSWNAKLGIRDSTCTTTVRDFNLAYYNFHTNDNPRAQFGSCLNNPNEIIGWMFRPENTQADPLFSNRASADYTLQTGSPAINAGQDGTDMGAYGGSDPLSTP